MYLNPQDVAGIALNMNFVVASTIYKPMLPVNGVGVKNHYKLPLRFMFLLNMYVQLHRHSEDSNLGLTLSAVYFTGTSDEYKVSANCDGISILCVYVRRRMHAPPLPSRLSN